MDLIAFSGQVAGGWGVEFEISKTGVIVVAYSLVLSFFEFFFCFKGVEFNGSSLVAEEATAFADPLFEFQSWLAIHTHSSVLNNTFEST